MFYLFFSSFRWPSDPFFLPLFLPRTTQPQADLTQQAALAVSQQSVAYAVAILGENLYQRALLQEGAGGRPALLLTIAGAASAAASAVLVGSGGGAGPGATLGLVVGAVGALGTLLVSVKRVRDVKSDPFVGFSFFFGGGGGIEVRFFFPLLFSTSSLSFLFINKNKNYQAWPGPRSWPVFTSIASFAMAAAFVQAFVYGGQQ